MIARIVNKVPAMIAQWAGGEPGRYAAIGVNCGLCALGVL